MPPFEELLRLRNCGRGAARRGELSDGQGQPFKGLFRLMLHLTHRMTLVDVAFFEAVGEQRTGAFLWAVLRSMPLTDCPNGAGLFGGF